jgi:hypothetical protein
MDQLCGACGKPYYNYIYSELAETYTSSVSYFIALLLLRQLIYP